MYIPDRSWFVWPKIDGIHIYSCSDPSSQKLADFENILDRLVLDAKGWRPKLIAGDFNA